MNKWALPVETDIISDYSVTEPRFDLRGRKGRNAFSFFFLGGGGKLNQYVSQYIETFQNIWLNYVLIW